MTKILLCDDEIFARIKGKSYKDNCTVPREDLRYLHVLHKDLDGKTHEGEMICNVYIAADLLDIFQKLYEANYPIEKIRLVDEYNADDETSMRDNNSSCFNFRFISHTTKVSKHGLGLAVDINTLYNPYVKVVNGKKILEPATAEKYIDRSKKFSYKIEKNDLASKSSKKIVTDIKSFDEEEDSFDDDDDDNIKIEKKSIDIEKTTAAKVLNQTKLEPKDNLNLLKFNLCFLSVDTLYPGTAHLTLLRRDADCQTDYK